MSSKILKPHVATTPVASAVGNNCMEAPGTWYYDHLVTQFAPGIYADLLGRAKNMVQIWDPYIYPDDVELLRPIPFGVEMQCLTSFGFDHRQNFDNTRVGKMIQCIDRDRSFWVSRLTVRYYNVFHDGCGKGSFHDRYLFIDNQVYSVGSSLAYHRQRNGSTAIHQIQDPQACSLIRRMFENYWQHPNTQTVFPVKGVHYET